MTEHTSRPGAQLRDVRSALGAAAQTPVESIDSRLEALEARLLRAIEDDERRGAVLVPVGAPPRSRRSSRVLVGVATAACIIGIVVVAAGWFSGADADVVIAAADDVSVVLPDGSIVTGAEGLELPEGSLLDVDGSLVVDGRTFGPGDYIVGPDGIVPAPGSGDVADSTTTTGPPAAGGPTTDVAAPGDDRPVRTVAPATTVRSPSATGPTATRPPVTSPPTRPPTTTGQPPTTSPPRTTSPAPTTVDARPTTAPPTSTTPNTTPNTTPGTAPTTSLSTRPSTAPSTTSARGDETGGDAGGRTRSD